MHHVGQADERENGFRAVRVMAGLRGMRELGDARFKVCFERHCSGLQDAISAGGKGFASIQPDGDAGPAALNR